MKNFIVKKNLKEGISAVLVVYNEEKIIERCLKSLKNSVDEIILIHDGPCEDKTLEIAAKYTDNVVIGERRGMCELHYIEALQEVSYSWVLRLDADEYLGRRLQKEIKQLILKPNIDAYTFLWKIWNGEKYITKDFPRKKSLFKMEKVYYIEFPHTEFDTTGVIVDTAYVLEHKPLYNNYTFEKVSSKWKKWCVVHAQHYKKESFRYFQAPEVQIKAFRNRIDNQVKYSHILLCPIWSMYAVLKSLFLRGFYRNISTWKIAIFQGIYAWYLCLYLSRLKK